LGSGEWFFSYNKKKGRIEYCAENCSIMNILRVRSCVQRFLDLLKSRNQGEEKRRYENIKIRFDIQNFLEIIVIPLFKNCSSLDDKLTFWHSLQQALDSDILREVLDTIIYRNLAQAQNILKVVKGVYIEFNEVFQDFEKNEFQPLTQSKNIFEKNFVFGKTQYYMCKYVLVIRLNVYLKFEQPPK
jgi:hypothetical protein